MTTDLKKYEVYFACACGFNATQTLTTDQQDALWLEHREHGRRRMDVRVIEEGTLEL